MPNLDPISVSSLIGVIFIGYLNLRDRADRAEQRNEITKELEKLRAEFDKQFVPVRLDTLQHEVIGARIKIVEEEITKNRDNLHELRGQFTQLIMGKLERIETQLTDKVRRMANIESRIETMSATLQDVAGRIRDLERDET